MIASQASPQQSAPPKILVFDSGVGGLSILREIRQRAANCRLVFACDNEAYPYGTKSEEELVSRVDRVLRVLIGITDPDMIVVACNTASTLILPRVRAHFRKPVVGVVPAVKPAAGLSQSRTIGLLATPATISRAYTRQLIEEFAPDCRVIPVGTTELVDIAEAKLRGETLDLERVKEILAPLFAEESLDTIVLACTHFPLLRRELISIAPRPVRWLDSGQAIARRVESLMPEVCNPQRSVQGFHCLLTRQPAQESRLPSMLEFMGCKSIEAFSVE